MHGRGLLNNPIYRVVGKIRLNALMRGSCMSLIHISRYDDP